MYELLEDAVALMHAEPVRGYTPFSLPRPPSLRSSSAKGEEHLATRIALLLSQRDGPIYRVAYAVAGVRQAAPDFAAARLAGVVVDDVEVDLTRHPTTNMAIPAYLTSGASSRAHHALIVALNDARSPQEEQAIAAAEVQRIRNSFAQPASTVRLLRSPPALERLCQVLFPQAKVAERLIILLHCDMVLAGDVGWDWALMPALQLAEGGKTLKERRIGVSGA